VGTRGRCRADVGMASSELSVSHQIKTRLRQLYGRVYAGIAWLSCGGGEEEAAAEGVVCCWLVDVVDV
jgi:hypothetical protein